jgi:hypothetical protein
MDVNNFTVIYNDQDLNDISAAWVFWRSILDKTRDKMKPIMDSPDKLLKESLPLFISVTTEIQTEFVKDRVVYMIGIYFTASKIDEIAALAKELTILNTQDIVPSPQYKTVVNTKISIGKIAWRFLMKGILPHLLYHIEHQMAIESSQLIVRYIKRIRFENFDGFDAIFKREQTEGNSWCSDFIVWEKMNANDI